MFIYFNYDVVGKEINEIIELKAIDTTVYKIILFGSPFYLCIIFYLFI